MHDILNQIMNHGAERKLAQLATEDLTISGSTVHIDGKELVNFSSCSYLGLEFHPALREGVHHAVDAFGTQFSSSRAYLSIGMYTELEQLLQQAFQKPVIVTASTTLGHLAALPTIVREGDAVVLDLQVHSSVQMSVQILKARNISTYVIPHNDMDALESKIKTLRGKHKKIWYLADGVYSMYGDCAPVKRLERLLHTYKQFHLYIDDAHGMGWAGENGTGYVRSQIAHHEKMVLVTSLNKSFATSGGVLVLPNAEMRKEVFNCGSTLIFSGPIQPPMLGAAIASAKLHLSDAIIPFQKQLQAKIEYTNKRLKELNLPQYQESDSPLFFVPCGLTRYTSNIVARLKSQGFYINGAVFPAVPMKKTGLRFMINNNLSLEQIDAMLTTMQREYVLGLEEEGSNLQEVAKTFRLQPFNIELETQKETRVVQLPAALSVELHTSIAEVDAALWDQQFAGKGSLLHSNLSALEDVFSNNVQRENNWKFYYLLVRDSQKNTVLSAHFSCAQMMDDMLSSAEVSLKVKEQRADDPYFLTSKAVLTGSLFTKGEAIVVDTTHDQWTQALQLLIREMIATAEAEKASKVLLRDLEAIADGGLKDFMLEQGFVSNQVPANCMVENLNWNSVDQFMDGMNSRYRYSFKKEILAFEDRFEVRFDKPETPLEEARCYDLYTNVHDRALELSVFQLPQTLFDRMHRNDQYDVMRLYLKHRPEQPVAVMYSFINQSTYSAMIVGLDYNYVRSHNTYKQILFQTVKRARQLGCKTLDLAYTAEMEKKKVGAVPKPAVAYVMALEHFSMAQLNALS